MLPALLWVALSVSPEAAREAKELTRHSMTEYDTGEFEKSLEDATHAFEIDPLPAFLFNIAQCQRAQHHWEKAEFFYRRYLAHVPKARNRKTVEALIAAVQIRQGKSPDVNAAQLPDLSPAPLVPGGQPPAAPSGDIEQATAKASPGLMQDVEAYPPVVVVREDIDTGPPNPVRAWAWGTTWLAVGLAVVGAGVGIGNVVATNGVDGTARPIAPSQESSVSSQLGLAQGLGITADALFIGAGASAVAALTLFLVGRSGDGSASVSVGPAPAGIGLGASGRF
jgi:hypothetical protein